MKSHVAAWVIFSSLVSVACQSPTDHVRVGVTTVEPSPETSWNPDETGDIARELERLSQLAQEGIERESPCPKNSVLVEGDYCPRVSQTCLQWVTIRGEALPEAKPIDGESGRCGTFKFPTVCLEKKIHVRFCIDKYELPNVEGRPPSSWMSFYDVRDECISRGERLCEKSEWTFACEGPDMHPLPYGDGYHRNSNDCNIDKRLPDEIKNAASISDPFSKEGVLLDSLRVPAGSMPRCVSPFGVFDMVGNIDEFVHYSQGHVGTGDPTDRGPYTSELVGGHYFGVRNACRPMTAHDEHFHWYETGGRCCSNPKR